MIIFFEVKKSKFRFYMQILLVMCMLILSVFPESIHAKTIDNMYARSYALTDGVTGRVLVGNQETTPMANASTTKILTCIVTLENCDIEESVVISENAASQPRVRLGMQEGEVYPLKDLLYGLMLESYNDCAVAIAEHVAGSVEAYADMLNQKAKDIGCKDTYFITPNGLDAETTTDFHHTTAEDLCNIMSYCVWSSPKQEMFLEITQTREYEGKSEKKNYHFYNRNSFLDQMEGVVSGKTGYTSKAGYCYVAALEKDGRRYCIALLACGWPNNKTYKWKDARRLFEHGIENYNNVKIAEGEVKEELVVDGCVGEANLSCINRKMTMTLTGFAKSKEVLLHDTEEVQKEIVLYTDEELPYEKGQVLGECTYYIDDVILESIPLVANQSCGKWNVATILVKIWLQYLSFS